MKNKRREFRYCYLTFVPKAFHLTDKEELICYKSFLMTLTKAILERIPNGVSCSEATFGWLANRDHLESSKYGNSVIFFQKKEQTND